MARPNVKDLKIYWSPGWYSSSFCNALMHDPPDIYACERTAATCFVVSIVYWPESQRDVMPHKFAYLFLINTYVTTMVFTQFQIFRRKRCYLPCAGREIQNLLESKMLG